ncbi:ester cyclase [Phytohabitans kaempferiae]|uniref:Ester cyclase n=1 Tax=Phytohabitans kaempferiae TaxID=1620943 RepID=A0ABV6M620_9ACTN
MADHRSVCEQAVRLMADGDLAAFERIIHPEAVNREASAEPPACRGRGPAAFHASALWLRAAFADLRWQVRAAAVDGDLVALHTTMSGRHAGTFVAYDEHARVADAFPATGAAFAVTQSHWFRVADGKVIEHWANRDDLAMARQLRWVPPTPLFLVRMAMAKRRARRASAAA